jgi:hypothetical protein
VGAGIGTAPAGKMFLEAAGKISGDAGIKTGIRAEEEVDRINSHRVILAQRG